jgi:hypothetical protein
MLPVSRHFTQFIKRTSFAGDDVFSCLAPDGGLRLGVVLQQVVIDQLLKVIEGWTAPIEWSGLNASAWWASGSIGTMVSGAGGRYPKALWGLTVL